MDLQAWAPNFNPNEDNPIVPIWVVIPKLPWNLYYREVLSVLLSHIGKVLNLDLASMQKTRGSVAKVKMQVDLTQDRPHHVWLGFDEDQDVNGDGQWLEVVFEDLPTYCLHCKHLGHEEYYCIVKKREVEEKRKAVEEAAKHQITNKRTNTSSIQNQQNQATHEQNKIQQLNHIRGCKTKVSRK